MGVCEQRGCTGRVSSSAQQPAICCFPVFQQGSRAKGSLGWQPDFPSLRGVFSLQLAHEEGKLQFPIQPHLPQIRKSWCFPVLLVFASVQSFQTHLLKGIYFLLLCKIGMISRIWGVMKLRGPHQTLHERAPPGATEAELAHGELLEKVIF